MQLPGTAAIRDIHGMSRTTQLTPAKSSQVITYGAAGAVTVCKTVGSAYVGSNPTPATTCENGPLAVNSRLGGPFPSCHAPYHDVSP